MEKTVSYLTRLTLGQLAGNEPIDVTDPCPACGCVQIKLKDKFPHIGKYCYGCDKWQGWIKREAVGLPPRSDEEFEQEKARRKLNPADPSS